MNAENKQVIEINGVKMEVDLRHAKRLDTLVVGSKVKLLEKGYSTNVHSGVVVGFEPFQDLPTIIVCYLEIKYTSAELHFAYINTSDKSKEKWDLVVSIDEELPIQKADVLSKIDREISKKNQEIDDLNQKRSYFLNHFNKYFEESIN